MELKKCIVLDLDNTLWGGIVGEDGKEGLLLSLVPPGSSFIAFQQALLDH
jgi:predicted enzyme involved in methoxymalonyl-ACP biosynthesis